MRGELIFGEFEISQEMIEAGERVVLEELGGADLGGLFAPDIFAQRVLLAMLHVAPPVIKRRGVGSSMYAGPR